MQRSASLLKILLLVSILVVSGPLAAWQAAVAPNEGSQREKKPLTVGIVTDGDRRALPVERQFMPLLVEETTNLLEREYDVRFPESKILRSNWSVPEIRRNFQALLNDPDVDVVVCMGVLATLEACTNGPYDKPVFGPFGIDSSLPGVPFKGGSSGVKNLNYLITPGNLRQDARVIRTMKSVKRVHLVADQLFAQIIPGLTKHVSDSFAAEGMDIQLVNASDNAEQVLAQLPPTTEFVYLAPLLRFSDEERDALYQQLIRRGLPSFSLLGRKEVERGVLAGTAAASDYLRWYRRLALNIQRALMGEDPGTFSVIVHEKSRLTLNMGTAREIGWYPSWELQNSAELVNEEPRAVDRRLTMKDVVLTAIDRNPQIKALEAQVEATRQAVNQVRANRLPQLDASVTGLQVDDNTAASSFGAQPEKQTTGSVSLSQVLFSEEINSAVRAQELNLIASQSELESVKLDLAEVAANRFLNFLKARTLYHIQKDNLSRSMSHLETSQTRRNIGIGNPSEVYRWESQVARDKQTAIESQAQMHAALYALNQVMNEPAQELLLDAVEPNLMDPEMITGHGRLQPYVANALAFEKFRAFMVEVGLKNAPELARLDALIEAKRRLVVADKRAYYLPTVALQGKYDYEFDRSGAGTTGLAFPGTDLPEREDDGWNVALNVSLPLFQGGARKATLKRDTYEQLQLEMTRESAAQNIELDIRASLRQVGAAAAAIDLSRAAADAARKNMELIDDSYRKGVASALDVLDAQNAALVADQSAANSLYDFMLDLIAFQRAAANMDFFMSSAERDAFFERLKTFYEAHR
ncbi:TolC family protein [Sulfidibacter corallicola]|uniref:TolC family protein n=1 Tax=Sulfidibacter corallicola TaxID=2818388 RepID=A0A8A4TVL7_SULCO|nr:TolC family protein [Sulfidibacter corallicola]QTD53533.1 TolC family protein [Sulfidibacter corallicola]